MDNDSRLKKSELQIEGFELWIHERQFSDSEDYWDGNWLMVTAQYKTNSTCVSVHGPILHLSELKCWLVECKQIYTTLSGEAKLSCMEPNLEICIAMKGRGLCDITISITPDDLLEEHYFNRELDQSFFPQIIKDLEDILNKYPLKGLAV